MAQNQYRTLFTPGAVVRMVYRRADGDIQERIVEVERVHTMESGATAIFAHCRLRDETRCFNLNNVLWATVDTGEPIRSFTAQEMLEASTRRLMAAHIAACRQSDRNATNSDGMSGWD